MEQSYGGSRVFPYCVSILIELVRDRPIIWDSSRIDFRSFTNKEKAWREIYEELDDKYRSADPKTKLDIGMRITAKWRNIRDAFMRSFKKRAQYSNVKKYMYHDRLTFMLKLLTSDQLDHSPQRRLSTNSESTNENLTEACTSDIKIEPPDEPAGYEAKEDLKIEPAAELQTSCSEEYSNSKRRSLSFDDGKKVRRIEMEQQDPTPALSVTESSANTIDKQTNTSPLAHDEYKEPPFAVDGDEAFLASTLSYVRDMTKDEKLDFRIAVMHLIRQTRLKRMMTTKKAKASDHDL